MDANVECDQRHCGGCSVADGVKGVTDLCVVGVVDAQLRRSKIVVSRAMSVFGIEHLSPFFELFGQTAHLGIRRMHTEKLSKALDEKYMKLIE